MVLKLLLAAVLAAGLASAQRGGGGGGGSKGGGTSGGDMGMRPQRQSPIDTIAEKLKLTKEQKDELGKIVSEAREKSASFTEQIHNGRSNMTQMLIAGKNSGDDWDNLMKAFTGVLAQQEAVETEAYQKLYATLDDKQKPKAGPVFEELMAGLFAGRGAGRMGGRQ
ncbi:conserved exported hypothetical protein [Candidatus Sulfopaludibacter sp. SbA3]|nr:conserved exported hypothetical protein [Candidatus Sulfopaludibacter sp. SbA3]